MCYKFTANFQILGKAFRIPCFRRIPPTLSAKCCLMFTPFASHLLPHPQTRLFRKSGAPPFPETPVQRLTILFFIRAFRRGGIPSLNTNRSANPMYMIHFTWKGRRAVGLSASMFFAICFRGGESLFVSETPYPTMFYEWERQKTFPLQSLTRARAQLPASIQQVSRCLFSMQTSVCGGGSRGNVNFGL